MYIVSIPILSVHLFCSHSECPFRVFVYKLAHITLGGMKDTAVPTVGTIDEQCSGNQSH